MAYVPGFRYDLFFSYATEDNADGWVEKLEYHLTEEVTRLLGRPFSNKTVFFDKLRLHVGEPYPDEMDNAARDSAVLVVLLSPGYLNSEWCLRELQAFQERLVTGATFAECLVAVRVRPTGVLPAPLQEAQRQDFVIPEFHQPWNAGSPRWVDIVDRLAVAIRDALTKLRSRSGAIFVGSALKSHPQLRAGLVDFFADLHFRATPDPVALLHDTIAVRSALTEAACAVHFIGGASDTVLETIEISIQHCPGATILFQPFGAKLAAAEEFFLGELNPDRYPHRITGNDIELKKFIEHLLTARTSLELGSRNNSAILQQHFRTRSGERRPLNEAKLILIGRGEVGKTSLVDRLVYDRFHSNKKTEGIQITRWPIQLQNSETIGLYIWDFGGQEIMHATHQFFLTDRSLYLVVLNGREGGEDADVEYWLKLIESFGGESPVIVVLNKIRQHRFDLNRRALREKYHGRVQDFITTDCEDGTGIEELRLAIRQQADRLPHLRDSFPAAWFRIKDRLASMEENFLPFDRFRELCCALGEAEEQEQNLLATALHCLGIALNYKDDSRLRDTHVLNPHWVTKGIYKILNSDQLEVKRGELTLNDVREILELKAYPPVMHEFLLNLMRKFELCFRFSEPRDDTFLIPQLLGKEQPELGHEFGPAACLNFQYAYPVWPEGLLPRFIVRTHALSAEQSRWRSGVVLQFEGNRALVKADPQEKTVLISVAGRVDSRRRLLAVIRSDFERIHADLSKLNAIAGVPLPEDPSVVIPYEELTAFESAGVMEIPRVVRGKVVSVNVGRLLNSVELLSKKSSSVGPLSMFVSYSHKDDDLRGELDTHLKLFQRLQLLDVWHDQRITPGDNWKESIDRNLETSDLILLLVSAEFLASDYCYEIEMKRALELHDEGKARVVPILVRDCEWKSAPFGRLEVLPKKGRPVRRWRDRDSAWKAVAQELEQIITDWQAKRRRVPLGEAGPGWSR